ncbi:hypothetical protein Hanom_Chr09g00783661 [Helianthus anomalus]
MMFRERERERRKKEMPVSIPGELRRRQTGAPWWWFCCISVLLSRFKDSACVWLRFELCSGTGFHFGPAQKSSSDYGFGFWDDSSPCVPLDPPHTSVSSMLSLNICFSLQIFDYMITVLERVFKECIVIVY